MTNKNDFTAEEWAQLEAAPVYAGMYIIAADPAVTSMFKESAALAKAMIKNPIPAGGQDLISGIVADLNAKAANKEAFDQPQFDSKDPASVNKQLMEYLAAARALVEERASPEEAAAYKEWVLSVAQSVAESGREGGFLGIGSVKVSDQEKAALGELHDVLVLS